MAQVLKYKVKVRTQKSPDIEIDEDINLSDLLKQEGVSTVAGDSSVSGDLNVTGTSTLHTVSAGVATVTDVVDSGLTASRVVFTDANKKLVSLATAGTTVTALTAIASITIVNGIVTAIS